MSDSPPHDPRTSGFAARLGIRARGDGNEPTMVPYRPDRPANRAISPESPLAEYGVFEDTVSLQDGGETIDETIDATIDETLTEGSSRALPAPVHPEDGERSTPAQGTSQRPEQTRHDPLRPHLDVHPSTPAPAPPPETTTIQIIERIQDRLAPPERRPSTIERQTIPHGIQSPTVELESPPPSPSPSRAPHTVTTQAVAGATLPLSEGERADHRPTTTPAELRVDLQPRSATPDQHGQRIRSTPPATDASPPTDDPARSPRSHIRPRERSTLGEDIHLSALAESSASPVIRIGSITVEVIEAPKRPEPRRVVQQPPRRNTHPSSPGSGSEHRVSRPLRTFGLRQL